MLHTVQVTDTSQNRESGLHSRITAKKPLLKNTNEKRLVWAKKYEKFTLDQWKFVVWSGVQIGDFWFNRRVFVSRGVGEQMISACVFPTIRNGGVIMV